MEHKIEFDCECTACNGTGLYVGLDERDGFAVVCRTCKGTGKIHQIITYRDFECRKNNPKVKWVLETNPGICVGKGGGKNYRYQDFGGMPYSDWYKNLPFPEKSEMRRFVCPAWWYQSTNYDLKPNWCNDYGFYYGSFSCCKRFDNKELCWARFDKEHSK